MSVHESGEMYLEAILVLSQKTPFVRSVDVGEYLGYSKPSVSRAMGILREENYITVGKDGGLLLTEKGRALAETIYERHTVLSKMLIHLGVSEETPQRTPAAWSTSFPTRASRPSSATPTASGERNAYARLRLLRRL